MAEDEGTDAPAAVDETAPAVTVDDAAAALAAADAEDDAPIPAKASYDAVGRPYVPYVPEATPAAAPPEEAELEVPKGHDAVVYRGIHDSFEHGPFKFRPGKPVVVPSDVAEELLTYPFEPFERL